MVMGEDLLTEVARRAIRYVGGLGSRSVAPRPDAVERLDALGGPLPAGPTDPAAVLALLDDVGSPATVATAGPRYFGYVTGGALPVTVAASWLATAWDQPAFARIASPVAASLEDVALQWLLELFDLPPTCAGAFVTGATMANFCGLAAARHAVLGQCGWDVEADGLFGAPPVTVVIGEEAHASLVKALGMVGLGRKRVTTVPTDEQGRMRSEALPRISGPTIVCLQAGNVNTGAFDPAEEVIQRVRHAGAWVHVDGAFGLWAKASPSRAHLVRGFEAADSLATDGHKWLNVPYDCGLAFVRDPRALCAAMSASAAYLPQPDGARDPAQFTPEASRRARGVEVWAALKSLGRSGLADLVERTCLYAQRMADGLRAAGFTVLNEVVINQVLVSFGDDARTRRVIDAIQREGTCWCGPTMWHGHAAMRVSVSSWATGEADVARSLDAIVRVARAV
jgi:glutamate/tyrosine decarboxylase-like PLP-dependent enzyme